MTCEETKAHMKAYLADKMPARELEAFLEHIRSCPACYEELETNYIIERVLDILNDKAKEEYDFREQLQDRMEEQAEWLTKRRVYRPAYFAVVTAFVLMLIVGILELQGIHLLSLFGLE